MQLSREAILGFQQAYKTDFGEGISYEKAAIMASEFLHFIHDFVGDLPPELSTDAFDRKAPAIRQWDQ